MSSWKGIRLPAVAAIFVVTLAIAMVGSRVYTQRLLANPVQQQLAAVAGVQEVQAQPGSTWQIQVQLGPSLDLPLTYAHLRRAIDSRLGGRPFELRLQPAVTARTLATYEQMQLWVQEAMATGHFSDLPSALARVARRHGAGHLGVWVDGQFVYVRFEQDGDWFYALEPRSVANGPGWGTSGPTDRAGHGVSVPGPVTSSPVRGGSNGTNA